MSCDQWRPLGRCCCWCNKYTTSEARTAERKWFGSHFRSLEKWRKMNAIAFLLKLLRLLDLIFSCWSVEQIGVTLWVENCKWANDESSAVFINWLRRDWGRITRLLPRIMANKWSSSTGMSPSKNKLINLLSDSPMAVKKGRKLMLSAAPVFHESVRLVRFLKVVRKWLFNRFGIGKGMGNCGRPKDKLRVLMLGDRWRISGSSFDWSILRRNGWCIKSKSFVRLKWVKLSSSRRLKKAKQRFESTSDKLRLLYSCWWIGPETAASLRWRVQSSSGPIFSSALSVLCLFPLDWADNQRWRPLCWFLLSF